MWGWLVGSSAPPPAAVTEVAPTPRRRSQQQQQGGVQRKTSRSSSLSDSSSSDSPAGQARRVASSKQALTPSGQQQQSPAANGTPPSLTPTHASTPVQTAASSGQQASASVAPIQSMPLDDERWWRDALAVMQLDAAQFTAPLALAAGQGAQAQAQAISQLNAPFSAPPPSPSSNVFPYFHLSEEQYLNLAPRVLATFPHIALLRFKLVPARLNEERFWRTLFLLVARFHAASTGAQAASANTAPAPSIAASPTHAASAQHSSPPPSQRQMNGQSHSSFTQPRPLPTHATPPGAVPFPTLPPLPALHPLPPLTTAPAAAAAAGPTPAQVAADQSQLRDLQAALSARDAHIAQQASQIALLQQKLQCVTAQLQNMHSTLQHAFQIAGGADMNSVLAAHGAAQQAAGAYQMSPLPGQSPMPAAAAAPAPQTVGLLPAAPPADARLSTAPVSTSGTPPLSTSSPAPATASDPHSHAPASRFFECARCHAQVPSGAPSSSSCRSHTSGTWTLSKDSAEFYDLPPELRGNLRKEKARRLAAVQHEMRFIIDSDDKTKAPGKWSCCQKEEYDAEGCTQHPKHALQASK